MSLLSLINADNFITINRPLAKRLGINATIFLMEVVNKWEYFKSRNELQEFEAELYFYLTVEDAQERTVLSRHEQEDAIKLLSKHGLIKKIIKGLPAKRYFTIYEDKIFEFIQFKEKFSNLSQRDELDGHNVANQNVTNPQTHIYIRDTERDQRKKEEESLSFSFGNHIKMKQKEYDSLIEVHGKNLVDSIIHQMDQYLEAKGKTYKNYYLEVQQWIARDWNKNSSINSQEKLDDFLEIAKKNLKSEIENNEIILGYDYVEFNRGINSESIKIGSTNWVFKIINNLQAMGKNPSWVYKYKEAQGTNA